MGKGAGSCISKSEEPPAKSSAAASPAKTDPPKQVTVPAPAIKTETVAARATGASMSTKVYIVFYSTYGHIYKMAQAEKEGVDSVEGCEGILFQVPETLDEGILEKMHAPPKPNVPVLSAKDLVEADGILFGFPTRYGVMAAQMKAFWDATGGLWQAGSLVGKPAGVFVSTATQGGGQETTALTAVTHLVHHGMIFVPPGYSFGPGMFNVEVAQGGTPYGAGTIAGPTGARQPSEHELAYAKHQGKYFAEKTLLLTRK